MQDSDEQSGSLTYQSAGVDVAAGNQFVKNIRPIVEKTQRSDVLKGIGGFAGLFDLSQHKYQEPVLVSATDGVGTKIKLAIQHQQHDTIGIDLVAMCVNDLICTGAKPLFFLDYYASAQLDLSQAQSVVTGIAKGCQLSQCSLIGGETAEMPGMYQKGDYDLAGFAVGIVEKSQILSAERIKPGNAIIGLSSSGLHSNGFSLVRKILHEHQVNVHSPLGDTTLLEALLEPTRIYVNSVLSLQEKIVLNGIAHVTGGGITENLPRILPNDCAATIDLTAIPHQAVNQWVIKTANLSQDEALRTFNCGIGLIIVIDSQHVSNCLSLLHDLGEQAHQIGVITAADGQAQVHYQ